MRGWHTIEFEAVRGICAGSAKRKLFKGCKAIVPDTADCQRAYFFSGERAGCEAVCEKYKGSKPFRRRKNIIQLCKTDY